MSVQKKKKGHYDDEDLVPLREQGRKLIEGPTVTVIMTLTTLFALFGDDMRIYFTTKEADPYFNIALVISFFLFGLELLIQSCVVDDFKYSFFFWLDFIATLSLIPDISWFSDLILCLMGLPQSKDRMDVVPGQVQMSTH